MFRAEPLRHEFEQAIDDARRRSKRMREDIHAHA